MREACKKNMIPIIAGNGRTRASGLQAAISTTNNAGCTGRQLPRAALVEHPMAPEQARVAPNKHSALALYLQGHLSSNSRTQSRFPRWPIACCSGKIAIAMFAREWWEQCNRNDCACQVRRDMRARLSVPHMYIHTRMKVYTDCLRLDASICRALKAQGFR